MCVCVWEGVCNLWVCVCVALVICGCVYVRIFNMCVYMCGFCNVCVCVGFVMCGCVYVWVL
jgi:hypothetical protein